VAVLGCRFGQFQGTDASQVVAYNEGGGQLIGQVHPASGNETLYHLAVQSDGAVRVGVYGPLEPAGFASAQFYTYRWGGAAFALTGPPVEAPSDGPTDLDITATLDGALLVTVHNGGPASLALVVQSHRTSS
jgi:hypothetical protein